ncbi:MAG TPA: hypothetical protein VFD82_01250 [Planctomycetota bacterium]|nr:hypothetical protein [Planctomycetota bacterium]
MTDPEAAPPTTDTWEGILEALSRRYPGQKHSVLFCIYKLQQNPDVALRDFRAEAELHGIPVGGRTLHAAKELLGLNKPPATSTAPAAETAPATATQRRRQRAGEPEGSGSIESKVLAAVRQIQSNAGAEAEQLRAAIRRAITILQQALDGQ